MNIPTTAFNAVRTAMRQVDMGKVSASINVASNIAGKKALQVTDAFLKQADSSELTSKILSTVMDAFQSGRSARDVEHTESGGSFRMDGAAHGADKVNYEREKGNPTVMSFLGISDKAGKVLLSLGKSVAEAFTGSATQPLQDPSAARQARHASFASKASLGSTLLDMAVEGFRKARTQQGAAMPTSPPSGPPPRAGNFPHNAQQANARTYANQPWANTPPPPPRGAGFSQHARPAEPFANRPWADNPPPSASSGRFRASSAPPPPPRPESPPFASAPWAETETPPPVPPRPHAGAQQAKTPPPPPPRPRAQPHTDRPRASSTPPPRPPKQPLGSDGPSAAQPNAKSAAPSVVDYKSPDIAHIQDAYALLGLDKAASETDIKTTFRRLSLQHHPDKNAHPNAPIAFHAIKTASDILLNPQSRTQYDDNEIPNIYTHNG